VSLTLLRFDPDPWTWRRSRKGRKRHAISDSAWLPSFNLETACGLTLQDFPVGTIWGEGPKCRHCLAAIERERHGEGG
jgi:hypothetical protein